MVRQANHKNSTGSPQENAGGMKCFSRLVLSFMLLILVSGCHPRAAKNAECVPVAPDYADSTQWHVVDRQGGVDLFYIVSTETGDYSVAGGVCHYSDTYSDSLRALLLDEMRGVDRLLSGELNYFSPYYRQCTLETFTADSLVRQRMPLALGDVRQAFAYYLTHLNGGRPFILAGFSQGAIAVVDLLKEMEDATYSRLVAAYVIGWKVTDEDLAATYNSVRTPDCAIPTISDGNRLAINPVNWHTDGTPARLASPISSDTVSIALDTAARLLLVDGYSRTDYILPLIGREGNYHCLEISLYAACLRRNMALRAGAVAGNLSANKF